MLSANLMPAGAEDARYVAKSAGRTSVIVFIHGLFGDASSTWSNGPFFWPAGMAKDSAFADFNVYSYGYPTPFAGKTYTPEEIADLLHDKLNVDEVLEHKNIVIVAHSLGGLIARKFVLRYTAALKGKLKLIYFFGTPSQGSPLATIGSLVSGNPQLGRLYPISGDTDSHLFREAQEWLNSGVLVPSYCAYEKRKTYGVQVVPAESATYLCNRVRGVDEDHLGIVKPTGADAIAYITLKSAIKDELGGRGVFTSFKDFYTGVHTSLVGGTLTKLYAKVDLSRPLYAQIQLFDGDTISFGPINGVQKVQLGGRWEPFTSGTTYTVRSNNAWRVVPQFDAQVSGDTEVVIAHEKNATWPRVLDIDDKNVRVVDEPICTIWQGSGTCYRGGARPPT